ncbi:hypothetical protein H5P28_11715 [Ruficoccus amylovorans]|uniref:Uncharacterized protein n=1 Tax=Ruficoccus amylovorans TaxID=1804625 RepID=A0A842HH88_9BACT|nr:hypothetical protein [Ruficoccus amylovorans]MBC2594924.1 hypothetical protein [Ruficoccus amylovorans]
MSQRHSIPPISAEQIRAAANRVPSETCVCDAPVAPAYNNGMTESVRAFLSSEERVKSRINETLSVFAH